MRFTSSDRCASAWFTVVLNDMDDVAGEYGDAAPQLVQLAHIAALDVFMAERGSYSSPASLHVLSGEDNIGNDARSNASAWEGGTATV